MKIHLIEEKCTGHARCAAVAPDIFTLNDDGFLEMADTEIAPDMQALARRGARACPERAIEVIED